LQHYTVERQEDFEPVFKKIHAARTRAMSVSNTALTFRERKKTIAFANRTRIPAMYGSKVWAEEGGLIAYGADAQLVTLESLDHVDRILRGARPADLPVLLPTRLELVVNLKTAKALGLTIPQSILLRAERVIA